MNGNWVKILDDVFWGYLALPESGAGPGLILLSEIFGVNNHIRKMAHKFASEGYVVLAPDMFYRACPRYEASYKGSDFKQGLALINSLKPKDILSDLDTVFAKISAMPEVTGGIGVTGYCMGGSLAFRMACELDIKIAVCYYGGHIVKNLDKVNNIKGKVVLHFAQIDEYISLDDVNKIKAAFGGRPDCQIYYYPGTQHGFNCDERPSYNHINAQIAYARSLDALRLNIGPTLDLNQTWQDFENKALKSSSIDEIAAMLTPESYIYVLPSLAGAKSSSDTARFFSNFNKANLPDDFKVSLVSRTVSANRIIDEIIISFTHSKPVPFLIPNISPTFKPVKFIAIVICEFKANKLSFERIYYDLAVILSQLDLIDKKLVDFDSSKTSDGVLVDLASIVN